MGKRLQGAFAQTEPERFARLLGQSEAADEALAILHDIPDGTECDVVTKLAPEAADRLLRQADDSLLSAWLDAATVDSGRNFLRRLDAERTQRVVAGVADRSKRRALRRLSGYPAGSVGELVQVGMVTVSMDETTEEIESRIQQGAGPIDGPVVVVRPDGGVLGVLDPMRLVHSRGTGLTAADLCIPIEPLNAGSAITSLRLPDEWGRLSGLPVVGPSGRLLGYISHASLDAALSGRSESSLFLESAIELVRHYWAFLLHVSSWMLDRRDKR